MNNIEIYTKILLRLWDARGKRGVRLSAEEVEVMYQAILDGVTREDLIAQLEKEIKKK